MLWLKGHNQDNQGWDRETIAMMVEEVITIPSSSQVAMAPEDPLQLVQTTKSSTTATIMEDPQ